MRGKARPTLPAQPTGFIHSIQALRGVAALMVVFFHATEVLKTAGCPAIYESFRIWGAMGVDIFFCISGFIMVHVISKNLGRKGYAREFLIKRFWRVMPLYWIYTVLAFLFYNFFWGASKAHLLQSFLFTSMFTDSFFPILRVGWTLFFEMVFYLVCFLLMCLKKKTLFLIGCMAALGVLPFVVEQLGIGATDIGIQFFFIEILYGVIVGIVYGALHRIPNGVAMGVFTVSILLISPPVANWLFEWATATFRFVVWGIPCSLLVFSALYLERAFHPRIPALLLGLGNSSYTLFLAHQIILYTVLTKAATHLLGAVSPERQALAAWVFLLGTMALLAAMGHALYVGVERPLSRLLPSLRAGAVVGSATGPVVMR